MVGSRSLRTGLVQMTEIDCSPQFRQMNTRPCWLSRLLSRIGDTAAMLERAAAAICCHAGRRPIITIAEVLRPSLALGATLLWMSHGNGSRKQLFAENAEMLYSSRPPASAGLAPIDATPPKRRGWWNR